MGLETDRSGWMSRSGCMSKSAVIIEKFEDGWISSESRKLCNIFLVK